MLKRMFKDFVKFLFIVLAPLCIGGIVYVVWRPYTSLLMFSWFEHLCLADYVLFLRNTFSYINAPYWFIDWFPNASWTFSFMTVMYWLWGKQVYKIKYFFILLPVFLGLTFELAQLFNLLPGTFDIGDILAHLVGALSAILIVKRFIFDDYCFSFPVMKETKEM